MFGLGQYWPNPEEITVKSMERQDHLVLAILLSRKFLSRMLVLEVGSFRRWKPFVPAKPSNMIAWNSNVKSVTAIFGRVRRKEVMLKGGRRDP